MMRTVRSCILFSLLSTIGVGCSSIHSTHVKRNLDKCGFDTKHLRGIPITLEVPEKFKVEIVEAQFVNEENGRVLRDAATGRPVVTRNVDVAVTYKKEIFTVDFVKPAAGTLTTGVDLDPNAQYFSEINNKITDTTIDTITEAIKNITGSISPLVGGRPTGFEAREIQALKRIDKTVAVGVFDINDRHALEKIHVFLCQHLTGCTPPCVPPGVAVIEGDSHLPVSPGGQFSAPLPTPLPNLPVPPVVEIK